MTVPPIMAPVFSRGLGMLLALLCMASAADDVASRLDVEVSPVEDPAPVDDEPPAHDPDAMPRVGSAFETRQLMPRLAAALPGETRAALGIHRANPPEPRALHKSAVPRRRVITRLLLPPPAKDAPA